MSKFNIGDYVIATKDLTPYFKSCSVDIIPKESVGKITCVTIDKNVDYVNIIWISEDIDKEYIGVSTHGLRKIPKKEFTKRAVLFAI